MRKIDDERPAAATPVLLKPGATCWRVAQARRFSILVDGAAYFRAMQSAMRKAERSIMLLGWDFDPDIQLDPDGDARPLRLLLEEQLVARPDLRIHILIWDMAAVFSMQRRARPQDAPKRLPRERLEYQVDGRHPLGAAHHQKLLVIDDAVAFCGGSDFTRNRWDTPEHRRWDPRRLTASGEMFDPRHDVVAAVDGAAAAALGDLARERWRRRTGVQLARAEPANDPWPEDLQPDARDISVGIARTEPEWAGRKEVREIEALHLAAIAAARRWIYLENQYFTSPVIAATLARRLGEADGPEIVVVGPLRSGGRLDRFAMDRARNNLIHRLRAADRHDRFRAYAPIAEGNVPITVHSKVAIVDDRFLRIGSANLNNRSLGLDSECDIALDGFDAEPDPRAANSAARSGLGRLIAEHLGASVEALAASLDAKGRLIGAIDQLNPRRGRRLVRLTPTATWLDRAVGRFSLFDPIGARDNWRPWRRRAAAAVRLRLPDCGQ